MTAEPQPDWENLTHPDDAYLADADSRRLPGGEVWEQDDGALCEWLENIIINRKVASSTIRLHDFLNLLEAQEPKGQEYLLQRFERAQTLPDWINRAIKEARSHQVAAPSTAFANFIGGIDALNTDADLNTPPPPDEPLTPREALIERLAAMEGKADFIPTALTRDLKNANNDAYARRKAFSENLDRGSRQAGLILHGGTALLGTIIAATGLFKGLRHNDHEPGQESEGAKGHIRSVIAGVLAAGFGIWSLHGMLQDPETRNAGHELLNRFSGKGRAA